MTRRAPVQREKPEQAAIQQLLTAVGGRVYVLGTRRRRGMSCPSCGTFVAEHQGTRQTPGLADLLAFLPRRGDWPHAYRLLLVECKAPPEAGRRGGRLSPDQRTFRDLAASAGVDHVGGDLTAVHHWLAVHDYVRPDRATTRDLLWEEP
jgi:hypothetical protein